MSDDLHRDIAVVTSDHVYRIRQLHYRKSCGRDACPGHCGECGLLYPCRTIQILDRNPACVDGQLFHEQTQSDDCVCRHPQSDHLYGDYYDDSDVKRKHQGECSRCGCQGYC